MSKTYVITDVHGRLDLLTQALIRAGDSQIIFLGDYVDRGSDSAGVIALLKSGQSSGMPWVFLAGNHEALMIESLKMPHNSYHWLMNGGDTTLASYGKDNRDPHDDLDFLKSLRLFYEDEHRIYVHAYANPDVVDPWTFSQQTTLWERYDRTSDYGWQGKHVVHGHTPLREPFLGVNRTNLDTGAVFKGGYLSVGVFDDDIPGGPIEVIEVTVGT